jgi:uncharacterized repeat protein (TIGR04052 family)
MNFDRPVCTGYLCLSAALALWGSGCGDNTDSNGTASADLASQSYTIRFAALVGDQPFTCGSTYSNIGTTNTTIRPLDFRLYIHNPVLVRATGEKVPLRLDQDRTWQRDRVALLDFEDGTGLCATGSPSTNVQLVGAAAPHSDYTGLEFDVGLPPELNHLDAATAPAPFNSPGLWWSWAGGYKFMRLDVASTGNEAWYIHLGSSNCTGKVSTGFTCQRNNLPHVVLTGFNPATSTVTLNAATLFQGSDLNAQINNTTDFVPGCMAFSGDPECPAIFERLGLTFESDVPSAQPQTFFGVR